EDFADETQISTYAAQAVDWSRYTGVVNGKPGNLFDPKGSATRAELATILQNFLTMEQPAPAPNPTPNPEPSDSSRILIAYFSATNNTENIANHLNAILDADLYEIVPETPYTSADLNYSDSSTRATREQNDASARPAISGSVDNMADYDVIFLGYPIWWGQAPRIISTFLESYDFAGKTIVPFCTSGSSEIGSSAANLHSLASAATWMDGSRFSGSASQSAVESWVDGLGLN
ncbi:MAG: S-layer homology domain-containing protein, partial [Oscillospiraceae bacterium]|nr:S-layer homology domain-containing protein [Oscillospiraceae bacterium]